MTTNTIKIDEMIVQYPSSVLLEKAQKANLEEVRDILIAMKKFVEDDANGAVGLALPQVGISQRAFVAKVKYLEKGKTKQMTEVFVNPMIQVTNKKTTESLEGCLSLEGESYLVKRPKGIKIFYKDIHGKGKLITLNGYDARVVLHENDHLDGILISEIGTKLDIIEED